MPAPNKFTLPAAPRARSRFWVTSVAAHGMLVAGLLLAYRGFVSVERERSAVVAVAIPGLAGGRPAPPLGSREAPERARPAPPPPAMTVPDVPPVTPTAPPPAPDPVPGTPNGILGGTPGSSGLAMRPGRGDPRLWVYPMYIPEGGGRPIDIDSLVRLRMVAMAAIMDSVARNGGDSLAPYRPPYRTPSWTFDAGGRTYGIDNQWIHLGIFKIPTAALALIPIPVQANNQQNQVYQQQMQMRADILRAAARSEAEEDFRRAVAQIRERKGREREEQRAREERERQINRDNDRPIP